MTRHIERALRVIELEAQAIRHLVNQIDEQFDMAIECILKTRGRVIVCGMGKSGIIGNKISATLASTGTPSFSMHPGEAFHGDLGKVVKDDIFLAISNSGETEEVLRLLPFLKDNGNTLISMTGNPRSFLATESDFHISIEVPQEACPLKLAPTSSTTATLVLGDAIALTLMEARGFKPENFARFHPGGSLGRKLLLRVQDEMVKDNLPIVKRDCSVVDLIHAISRGEQGIAIVVSENMEVEGLITDGDLRRAIEIEQSQIFSLTAENIMSSNPIKVTKEELVSSSMAIMDKYRINKLLVVEENRLVGILRK